MKGENGFFMLNHIFMIIEVILNAFQPSDHESCPF